MIFEETRHWEPPLDTKVGHENILVVTDTFEHVVDYENLFNLFSLEN